MEIIVDSFLFACFLFYIVTFSFPFQLRNWLLQSSVEPFFLNSQITNPNLYHMHSKKSCLFTKLPYSCIFTNPRGICPYSTHSVYSRFWSQPVVWFQIGVYTQPSPNLLPLLSCHSSLYCFPTSLGKDFPFSSLQC